MDFLQNYPDVTNAIGVVGFVVYIAGFSLVQAGHICGNGMAYALSNVVAATLVLTSLVNAFNIASFLIQVSFITTGLYGTFRKLYGRKYETERAADLGQT